MLCIAALLVAGCGGEDDDPERLSKSEYQAAILDVRADSSGATSLGRQLNDLLYGMPSSDRADRAMAELEKHGYALGRK